MKTTSFEFPVQEANWPRDWELYPFPYLVVDPVESLQVRFTAGPDLFKSFDVSLRGLTNNKLLRLMEEKLRPSGHKSYCRDMNLLGPWEHGDVIWI